MNIEEFNKKDILRDFEYELNKLCRSCIGTATEIKIKQQPLINLFEKIVWFYEKEKEKNKELESDIQQKNFEIKCLNSDIKNMYCEEGVIAILEDNFDLSREEAIQILEEE